MEDQTPLPRLQLLVTAGTLPLFTTVLQSGIEVKARQGETIGHFLSRFPGFTAKYLGETVQTIFLNGTAVDDLTRPFSGKAPVLALSAAMPGLAGAIFRRNSFHAALRTATPSKQPEGDSREEITVTLKLFNSIAKERGAALLLQGVCLGGNPLAKFLRQRSHLLADIIKVRRNNQETDQQQMFKTLDNRSKIFLNISESDG